MLAHLHWKLMPTSISFIPKMVCQRWFPYHKSKGTGAVPYNKTHCMERCSCDHWPKTMIKNTTIWEFLDSSLMGESNPGSFLDCWSFLTHKQCCPVVQQMMFCRNRRSSNHCRNLTNPTFGDVCPAQSQEYS